MSFYQTNNLPIRRFNVNNPSAKVVSPFATLARVCQIENIGTGSSGYSTALSLTASQVLNGSLIISPTGAVTAGTGAFAVYTLPSAFNLQEFLGGRNAFNTINNQLAVSNTGANDYFVLNVYNLTTTAAVFSGYDLGTNVKNIVAAGVLNKAVATPVLIQFTATGLASFGTSTSTNSYASYTLF